MLDGSGTLLLSAVAGYWVLERSSGHKGNVKSVGQVVGWVVIVVSLVGVACRVSGAVSGKGWCPFSSRISDMSQSGMAPAKSK